MSEPDREVPTDGEQPPTGETGERPGEVYGAAAERTVLAWQRTGLAVTLGCFVIFVASIRLSTYPVGVTAAALGTLIAASSMLGLHGNRYLRRGPVGSTWPALVTVTCAVTSLGVLGAVASSLPLFY
jgi:uncharacterized membrane protein YidH (DUF202 family)